MLLQGTVTAVLLGGPYEGQGGEVVLRGQEPPATLAFPPDGGGFVYRLDRDSPRGQARYRYSPAESPAHPGLVRADAEAVAEVARQRGMTVPELLAEVRAARERVQGEAAPAEVLFAEAQRRGVSVEVLLAEHDQSIATLEGVHL